jgi:hypothetical protein
MAKSSVYFVSLPTELAVRVEAVASQRAAAAEAVGGKGPGLSSILRECVETALPALESMPSKAA